MAKDKSIPSNLVFTREKFKYDTIEDMRNDVALKIGDVVELNGYYEAGDGADHKRKIEAQDDGSGVMIKNINDMAVELTLNKSEPELYRVGLYANIVHNGEVNVSWFGAKGDGVTDDTAVIQKVFNYETAKTIKIKFGTYIVSETLNINRNVSIVGESGNLFKLTNNMNIGQDNAKATIYVKSSKVPLEKTVILDNDISKSEVWIKLNDVSDVKVGDLIYIKGDFSTSPWTCDNRGYLTKGETNRIIAINSLENKIKLEKSLSDEWKTTEIVKAKIITPLTVSINGINIFGLEDKVYRGIAIENCYMSTISNCKVENTGIVAIESIGSFNSLIVNNIIINAYIGNPQEADQSTVGLGYGLRATSDTFTSISHNRVNGARHSVDISGGYPSRMISVDNNVVSSLKNEYGSMSTHGTAENCTFSNNIINGGGYGFAMRGENINIINNTVKNSTSCYLLGRNYFIKGNSFEKHLTIIRPELNEESNYLIIDGNLFKSANCIAYLNETDGRIFDKAYNYKITNNTLIGVGSKSLSVFITSYSGSDKIIFSKSFVFKDNYSFLKNGGEFNLVLDLENKAEVDKWCSYLTDSRCIYSDVGTGELGEQIFSKRLKKPAWWNGTEYVDATGVSFFTQNVAQLNTLYHMEKMKQENVYEDYISYMDEKTAYDKQQRKLEQDRQLAYEEALKENPELTYEEFMSIQPMLLNIVEEPQPSQALKDFMKKYL